MDKTILKNVPITDRLLRSWIRCHRKAWLDLHGDKSQRIWTAHRTLQLDHQYRSFASLMTQKPGTGIAACMQGESWVLGIRLKGITTSGISIEAHPPLLQKVVGKSCWGDFSYRPVLARQGKRLTKEHRLALAISSLLLEKLQKFPVQEALAVCKTKNGLEIELVQFKKGLQQQLIDSLIQLNQSLHEKVPPSLTSDRRKCCLCSWRGICNTEASTKGYLSEVSGIGTRRQQILQEIGINKIKDLASTDPLKLSNDLKEFGEQHSEVAFKLVQQAKVQHNGFPEQLDSSPAIPELEYSPGVLIYDIESDPDERDDFLHGFLRIENKNRENWDIGKSTYHPMLMLNQYGESRTWKRLKRKLNNYQNWPILHYGETEALSLYRIAKRQGAQEKELKLISDRLIDIHARLKKHWRLPLKNYGLKSVAGWLGFEWSQTNADGARALLWWRQWNGTSRKANNQSNSLKWIFQYNKDDCLATWKIASWLLMQNKN